MAKADLRLLAHSTKLMDAASTENAGWATCIWLELTETFEAGHDPPAHKSYLPHIAFSVIPPDLSAFLTPKISKGYSQFYQLNIYSNVMSMYRSLIVAVSVAERSFAYLTAITLLPC